MNKTDLAARVATRTSISKANAAAAVRPVFSAIADALAGGETVRIVGFGAFTTRSRPGRNPRTGESIAIVASNTPSFKAGKPLREAVNNRLGCKRISMPPSDNGQIGRLIHKHHFQETEPS